MEETRLEKYIFGTNARPRASLRNNTRCIAHARRRANLNGRADSSVDKEIYAERERERAELEQE